MTWRIHSWDPETRTGAVVAPHFGPLPFAEEQNVYGTRDFRVGEAVLVELDGPSDDLVIRSVIATHQRQPPGTDVPALAEAGGPHASDLRIQALEPTRVELWLGVCCDWCSPGRILRFEGVHHCAIDEDADLWNVLIRFASEEESRALGEIPDGARAYCVVNDHGNGRDGARYLVVANRLSIAPSSPRGALNRPKIREKLP